MIKLKKLLTGVIFLFLIFLSLGNKCSTEEVQGTPEWKKIIDLGELIRIDVYVFDGVVYRIITTKGTFFTHKSISGTKGSNVILKIDLGRRRYICIMDELSDCARMF